MPPTPTRTQAAAGTSHGGSSSSSAGGSAGTAALLRTLEQHITEGVAVSERLRTLQQHVLTSAEYISRSSQSLDLSRELGRQFTSRPLVLAITGVFLATLSLTGLPFLPLAAKHNVH